MNRVLQVVLLSGLVLLVFSGCASKPAPVAQAPVEEKKTEVQMPSIAHTTIREPGSIWWEGSGWNQLYTGISGRKVGDVVLLKPTDGFKVAVAQKSGKGSGAELSTRENSQVIATVVEVLPREIYRVEAKQRLTVGTKEHELRMAGKVRERDIASDDTVSTDVVFDLNLQVEGQDNAKGSDVALNENGDRSDTGNKVEKPEPEKVKQHKPEDERMPDVSSERQPTIE